MTLSRVFLTLTCILLETRLILCQCGFNRLAIYRVDLETFWDQANFPRHFPFNGGKWSKTVGE